MGNKVWKAKWIWKNNRVEVNSFACFRKEITVKKRVVAAKAYVSAHNHFELYINKHRVSGYVIPAPTHPEKSKYYLCYDIVSSLNPGINTLGVLAHYLGGGGQNYVNGFPGFILQLEIEYEDRTGEIFITDESWRALDETPYKNGTEYQQNRKISAIEDYDAERENGWLENGFDDSGWERAHISLIEGAGWVLKPQEIPEGKIHEVIIPSVVGVQETGIQVFDAGKIISGWPRLEIAGIKGARLMLRYSEDMTSEGRVKHNVCNETSENYYDIYRMKGEGVESWEPSLSYKAFRYVEVTGYPGIIKPGEIKVVSAGTGLLHEGFFNCSSRLLNDIYDACIQTQKNNVLGQMVDCPHREQAQYLADSDLQAETFIYNFSNPEVLKKVLMDFKDGQLDDGRFQFVFPSNMNPQFDIKIPEWDLHFCTLLWKVYYYYSDVEFLCSGYETAKKTVLYYLKKRDGIKGLVPKGKGFPEEWNISDWPYPNIDGTGEALTVQNCLLYHVLGVMSNMAGILKKEEDKETFEEEALSLGKSIVKYLYNPEIKRFEDSLGAKKYSQGTNVVAYQYGLVPEEDRADVLAFITECGLNCSTLLSLNLLQVLFENGKGQEAYNLLNNREFPGWGYMLEQGYKTIWEGFQNIESHSHAWNAYPARLFVQYLAGIKAEAPGFEKIAIEPYIPSDMQYAEGRVPTAKGEIFVRWEKGVEGISLKVSIPGTSEVRISIPKPHKGIPEVYESGKPLWKDGKAFDGRVCCLGQDQRHIIFSAQKGQYLFECVYPGTGS